MAYQQQSVMLVRVTVIKSWTNK